MTFAFVSDKHLFESYRDGDKIARVYDLCQKQHPGVELRWIMKQGEIAEFQPDKIFVDPRLQGRKIPAEIADYPCEKDYTLELWFRGE